MADAAKAPGAGRTAGRATAAQDREQGQEQDQAQGQGQATVPDEEYLCTRIRRAEQALMGHHEAVLRGYGLTMTQYTVLLALSREDGMSGAQLARACGVTQQSMATVLTTLQGKDLIRREQSLLHAKVLVTHLTAQGGGLLDRAYEEVNVLERQLSRTFSAAEHAALCDLLDRATATLVEQTRKS